MLNWKNYVIDKTEQQLKNYQEFFSPFAGSRIKLLELGIDKGWSLLMWRDYFEKGIIVGLDKENVSLPGPNDRIYVYKGLQQDIDLLSRITNQRAPEGFDIIIDDCSHIGELTKISFWHLFDRHLKPGGIYAIEDWGVGYWDSFIDGKRYEPPSESSKRPGSQRKFPSHDYGMVGFIKELIDECGMSDITDSKRGISLYRPSRFEKMLISHAHIIIVKRKQ